MGWRLHSFALASLCMTSSALGCVTMQSFRTIEKSRMGLIYGQGQTMTSGFQDGRETPHILRLRCGNSRFPSQQVENAVVFVASQWGWCHLLVPGTYGHQRYPVLQTPPPSLSNGTQERDVKPTILMPLRSFEVRVVSLFSLLFFTRES